MLIVEYFIYWTKQNCLVLGTTFSVTDRNYRNTDMKDKAEHIFSSFALQNILHRTKTGCILINCMNITSLEVSSWYLWMLHCRVKKPVYCRNQIINNSAVLVMQTLCQFYLFETDSTVTLFSFWNTQVALNRV